MYFQQHTCSLDLYSTSIFYGINLKLCTLPPYISVQLHFFILKYNTVASEAYHDWSGEAADVQLRVNFTLKPLLSQNFCNGPLMRFISFASNIGPAATVPAGPAPAPLQQQVNCCTDRCAQGIDMHISAKQL